MSDSDTTIDPAIRIADLERELEQRDDQLKELRAELDEARELVDRMREYAEDHNRLIDQWIEVFEMERDPENGLWTFEPSQSKLWDHHEKLWKAHQDLLREWNKFVPEYNARVAPRDMGRPIAASAEQQAKVRTLRKEGLSLRKTAAATNLGLGTVRSILANRARRRTNEARRKELGRQRAAAFRARKRGRDALPRQIAEVQKTGEALVKEAKGLGRR